MTRSLLARDALMFNLNFALTSIFDPSLYKLQLYTCPLYTDSTETPGPDIMALTRPLPSSLFPARVALKAVLASSKA
jgi:hypothetical protein